ncbi:hypothetical protein GCM10012290_09600 [Halolactibacillus alkaliphilus]|uniref:LysM domain-containing protein n=1 Tax=Halolactibacillus alkaliphilus TaxID=442899 RepID=A0A511WXZ5_9BACI|nr:hypothetical protein HAL01_04590 [Halolactibacillus alkaliphilus]GGN68206.1 hypothetical protein GCM10012290_09600 [Halolactibacillus alkaliphilus]SFO69505.1 LysM domain-containing protein [Halolactibacillus alkaliphilus]
MLKNLINRLRARFNLRELILISALFFIGFTYLYLEFIISPLLSQIEEKQIESDFLTEELIQKRSMANRLPKLEEEYKLLEAEIIEKRLLFYPTNDQEFFINTMEDMVLGESGVSVPSIVFSEPRIAENLADGLYESSATFNYIADYKSIKDFVILLENEKEKVTISSFVMQEDRINNQYSGSITVQFYSVPRPFQYAWSNDMLNSDDSRVLNKEIFHRDLVLWKNVDRQESQSSVPSLNAPNNNHSNSVSNNSNDSHNDQTSTGSNTTEPDIDYFDEVSHTVKEGDTFEKLSIEYYGKSYYDIFLREMNNYDLDEELNVGEEIIIPGVMYLKDK